MAQGIVIFIIKTFGGYIVMACKTKAEQKKEWKEYVSVGDKRVLDVKKSGIELVADDEIFVIVDHTRNYWISNNGRMLNNLRGGFYEHNKGNGNTHYTLTAYNEGGIMYKIETYSDKLVAEHFLEKPNGYNRIWHIDKDITNNYYKNLIYVNDTEYTDLSRGIIFTQELGRVQQYTPYITSKSDKAYSIWNGIYHRCYKDKDTCYDGATICKEWLDNSELFIEWYNSNLYEIPGESMAVDKDLLYPGNKEYAPKVCSILPQTLNTMLSNCKKHKMPKWKADKGLPLGVRYDKRAEKYYGEIKLFGHEEVIPLNYHKTTMEAFKEYKAVKQADILTMAVSYKEKIPVKTYLALLKVEVEPY